MISVVIPAFNEIDAVGKTVADVRAALDAWGEAEGYEIIVVDDGSTDGTGDEAERRGARVIRHVDNSGYGRSLMDGIAEARHDIVAITDADGTYPVEVLPTLVAEIRRGFDMAVGARTGAEYRESVIKSPMRKVLRALVEFTSGRKIPDLNSGLRVFKRSMMMKFANNLCGTFSFTTSLTLAYMHTGKLIKYIDIPYYKRIGRSKVRLFRDSIRTLQFIVQAILLYNPIKLFMVLCFGDLLLSLACFLVYLGFGLPPFLTLSAAGLFVCLLIFSAGLLAEMMRQISLQERSNHER